MEGINSTSSIVSSDRRFPAQFKNLSRTFWIILSIALFFAVVGISVAGILSLSQSSAQGQQGSPRNQSAFVDGSGSAVTYYVTSRSNRTSAVLYDGENGYVCYKPAEQRACYLRRMDSWDLQNLRMALNASEQGVDQPPLRNNQTKYYREFLGISARKPVDPKSLGEAVQNLCEETPIFWARRGEDPGRQRLIYLCIDICFPSNVCVSICFYYLPE
ncbi:BRICHOS domain-containing protein 5 isoform X2 [Rhea pennata]|uniref:BRICHOS domain-containing protein 5 isoform X2 n=1 Tax=Rhea pennata TaxID=8795 RepID=UPI002E264AF6